MRYKKRKENIFFEVDNNTIGGKSTNKDVVFVFDRTDFELISKYVWHCDKDGYLVGKDCDNGYKIIKLSRLIMGFPVGKIVDHIDRDILNNRRKNLRIATDRESSINKGRGES